MKNEKNLHGFSYDKNIAKFQFLRKEQCNYHSSSAFFMMQVNLFFSSDCLEFFLSLDELDRHQILTEEGTFKNY